MRVLETERKRKKKVRERKWEHACAYACVVCYLISPESSLTVNSNSNTLRNVIQFSTEYILGTSYTYLSIPSIFSKQSSFGISRFFTSSYLKYSLFQEFSKISFFNLGSKVFFNEYFPWTNLQFSSKTVCMFAVNSIVTLFLITSHCLPNNLTSACVFLQMQ